MTLSLSSVPLPDILKLLAHDVRWQIVHALALSDYKGQELVIALGRPANLISYHLRRLREGHLVREHRSIADGRDVYYSLELDHLKTLYYAGGEAIHPTLATPPIPTKEGHAMNAELSPTRVLFLCTHNSARSQIAEGILRFMGRDRVEVYSAGNAPSTINPLAIRAAQERGVDISGQASKHLDDYKDEPFDYIITVCDRAKESCPVFPGDPVQIHWSFPDPTQVQGTERQKYQAFRDIAQQLTMRISHLLILIDRQRKGQLTKAEVEIESEAE